MSGPLKQNDSLVQAHGISAALPLRVPASRVSVVDEITIEIEAWPLIRCTFPRLCQNREATDDLISRLEHLLRFELRCAAILDFRRLQNIGAAQRTALASWMRNSATRNRRLVVGTALIIPSAIIRGAITAVHWLQPPVTPQFMTDKDPSAVLWCYARLCDSEVTISPALAEVVTRSRSF